MTQTFTTVLIVLINFHHISVIAFGYDLTRQGPIFIYEPPGEVTFMNNKGAVIDCLAHGYPDPVIEWITEDDERVASYPGLIQVADNGSLVFKTFDSESYYQPVHARIYRCSVSNQLGRILSRRVKVRAVVMQSYETQVYNEFVISGNVAVLQCHIPSYVRDNVFVTSWIREDKRVIKYEDESDDMYVVEPSGSLYVRDVQPEKQHLRFWCETRHFLTGKTKRSITAGKVMVNDPEGTVPPRITDRVTVFQARKHDRVILHCAGQGHPPPRYSWYYKNMSQEIIPLARSKFSRKIVIDRERVIISKASEEHSGTYICSVSNSAGKQQTETTLIINSPMTVYITPQVNLVDSGSSANFTCSVSGGPVKEISWFKNGYPVNLEEIVISTDGRNLSVVEVSKESEGMYQCLIENSWESGQGSAQLVLGAMKPTVIKGFEKAILQKGSKIKLECRVHGKPSPDIRWFLDGQRVQEVNGVSIRVHQADNYDLVTVLTVDKISEEQGGDYSCFAINKAGSTAHTTGIQVTGPPLIRTFRNVTAVAGDTIRVKCYVTGYPINNVIWMKDGNIPLMSERYKVTNRLLTIKSIEKTADSGRFTCSASNDESQSDSKDIWIKVIERPLLDDMADKDVEQEISLKLMCSAIKGDPPINFKWAFNNHPLPDNLGLMVTKHSDVSLLMIPSVQLVHQGNYSCTAINDAGNVTKTTKVLVRSPPSWKIVPERNVLVSKGLLKLDCRAKGNPKPHIKWNILIATGEKRALGNSSSQTVLSNGSLILWNPIKSKYLQNRFECLANNGLGKLSHVFRLQRGVPVNVDVENDEVIGHLGDEIKLSCKITGSEPLSIKWFVNDNKLQPSPKHLISHRKKKEMVISTISITNYLEKDSGEYKCLASNPLGEDYKFLILATVDVLPPSKIGPEHVTLKKGEESLMGLLIPVTIVCSVAILTVAVTVICIRAKNNRRRRTQNPLYGLPGHQSKLNGSIISETNHKSYESTSYEETPAAMVPSPMDSLNNHYSTPHEVPNYYCDISPYATFQLPQAPRPILTTFTSSKESHHQSTYV